MVSIFQIKEKESEDFSIKFSKYFSFSGENEQLFGYQMRIYMWKA